MSKAPRSQPPKDFESALTELERVISSMEGGSLSLEQSLVAYKRGMELSAFCQNALNEAAQQVKVLENGHLKDFQPNGMQGDLIGGE